MKLDTKESANTTWNAPTRRIVAVILGLAVLGTLLLTHYIWLELLLAVVLVFFLSPLISWLKKRLRFPLEAVLANLEKAINERSTGELLTALGGIFWGLGRSTANLLAALIAIGWTHFLVYIYAIYISADNGKMRQGIVGIIPEAYQPEITILGERIRLVWRTYVHGQIVVMLAVGVIVTIVAWLLGLASPLALGVIAGLLEIVPYFGPVLATIPAIISALVYGSSRLDLNNAAFAVIVIIAYLLIQQVEDLYLTPRIHGKSSKLLPLVVMISIIVAAYLAGIVGAIIAIPNVAMGREIFNYLYAKIQKKDPYHESVAQQSPSN
jgi:predicted PurR-regulated permease PerM